MPLLYVHDGKDYSYKAIEFEVELTEDIVKDYLDFISSKESYDVHSLDEWDRILEKDQKFVNYVEDVFHDDIVEKEVRYGA